MKLTGFQFGALAVILGGVVLLTLFDKPAGNYIALVTPILAAMYLDGRTEAQNAKLDTITHQTNGELTRRINEAVGEAVEKAVPLALEAVEKRSTEREDTDTQE